MKWNKFTLKTRSEVEDIVISTLADVGIEGVEIQDKQPLTESDKQQMFVDIMPDIPDDDGIAYLNFTSMWMRTRRRFLQMSARTCRNAGVPGPWRVHHHRV